MIGSGNKLINIAIVLLGLYIGQTLIIPFIIAIVVWYLLNSLADLFSKVKIGKRKISRTVQLFFALFLVSVIFIFIVGLVNTNYQMFAEDYPVYHANFLEMTETITEDFNLNFPVSEWLNKLDLTTLFAQALDSSINFVSTFFLVLLYVIFLLLEQRLFADKMKRLFKKREDYVKFLEVIRKIDSSIHSYVSIKTGLSLAGALLSYLTLLIIGVDFAILWAFLIFFFSFIPVVGSLAGIVLPSVMALVQFAGWIEPVICVSILATIQFTIGNFIEPKVLGSRLNLSPLVVIISLVFWGAIWGFAGMFLCVPITVIMMVIFAQFDSTKTFAILLSQGKTKEKSRG